jgi:hypothetical protein
MNILETTLTELLALKDEYIKMLGEECHEAAVIASLHHWQSTRIKQGEELRKKIKEVEDRLEKIRIDFPEIRSAETLHPQVCYEPIEAVPEVIRVWGYYGIRDVGGHNYCGFTVHPISGGCYDWCEEYVIIKKEK